LLALVCAFGVAACREGQRRPVRPSALPAATAAATAHHRPPVTAEWVLAGGVVEPRGTLDLRLRLTRHGAWPLPLRVRVALPEGAHLARGELAHEVLLERQREHEVALEVALDRVPADDLVAVIHSASERGGLHAEPRFRFGRPAPAAPVPPRARRPVLVGGRDFGAPVAMPRR